MGYTGLKDYSPDTSMVAQLAQHNHRSSERSPYNSLTPDQKLGLNIQILRRKHGWELSDLADRLFVSKSTLSKWERGERSIKVERLGAIAAVFGVDAKDLLP